MKLYTKDEAMELIIWYAGHLRHTLECMFAVLDTLPTHKQEWAAVTTRKMIAATLDPIRIRKMRSEADAAEAASIISQLVKGDLKLEILPPNEEKGQTPDS
jgi:hypothetical protein